MEKTARRLVERRAAKRVDLALPTRLLHNGLQPAEITVRDISFTGFQCEAALALEPGSLVSISLPKIGLVRATIKWCEDGRIAGAFHRPVDVRTCFMRELAD